ncbi:hypothetical protein [Arthrobacter celericrescens]|uniref:hypothetical protein n=1 Tax=Arthrobacter celericrescens TaxID=2320851 RepID=UPI001FDF58B3|nr:hypothetical protein [Arthrobacter celericrescens]
MFLTAATHPVRSSKFEEGKADNSGSKGIFAPPDPKTFQRLRTDIAELFIPVLLLGALPGGIAWGKSMGKFATIAVV